MNRTIFCTYWLYFYGFRDFLGWIRVLDYLVMALLVLGLMNLAYTERLHSKVVKWVSILCCPLALSAALNPSTYVILYVLKMYVVALYFAGYFKSMRLTMFEFVCFVIPVVVSVYYFLDPKTSYDIYFLKGRMAGIAEPNSTALSLIIAMCSAFGIYVLTRVRRVKIVVTAVAVVCFFGVVLTASRAGFIAVMIALSMFLVVERRMMSVGVVMLVVTTIKGVDSIMDFLNGLVVLTRFQALFYKCYHLTEVTSQRFFTELAWHAVNKGDWFIGGGPLEIGVWSRSIGGYTPHNSSLDIGIAFGKMSFYFYAVLLLVLLAVNVWVVATNWRCRNHEEKCILLTPILFFSALPMYMTLSLGMTMGFTLWVVLGAYPLLHASPETSESFVEESHISLGQGLSNARF